MRFSLRCVIVSGISYLLIFLIFCNLPHILFILRLGEDSQKITRHIYDAGHDIINPTMCLDVDERAPEVLIGVVSAPANRQRRMSIRNSWGNVTSRPGLRVAFFVGRSQSPAEDLATSEESLRYKDLIRGNSVDSYRNLSLKTVSLLEWTIKYCGKVRFILKADDDVFINVDNLLTFVEAKRNYKKTIFGELARDLGPLWWPPKWYVSSWEYSGSKYPDFLFGPAYLLTFDSVLLLYQNSLNMRFFRLEDVFITGIVAEFSKIERVSSLLFIRSDYSPDIVNSEQFDVKNEAKERISIHGIQMNKFSDIWNSINKR